MKTKRPTKALIQNAIAAVHAQGLQAYALQFGVDGDFRVELAPNLSDGTAVAPAMKHTGPKRYGEPK
ncbi:MAG: hypothetical protein KDK53_13920 [Maritimibacter sp.]|nr:hypothetical protein [Maritimibacter sp.]